MTQLTTRLNALISLYGSQNRVAQAIGVNRSTISRLVRGQIARPTFRRAINKKFFYFQKRALFQWRLLVRYTTATGNKEQWVSSNLFKWDDDDFAEQIKQDTAKGNAQNYNDFYAILKEQLIVRTQRKGDDYRRLRYRNGRLEQVSKRRDLRR